MEPTVFITGANSGIGYATAQLFLRQGYRVFATVRTTQKGKNLTQFADSINKENKLQLLVLDVTSDASVKEAFKQLAQYTDSLDVLINNAGFGYIGIMTEMTLTEMKDQFETNFFGVHRVTQAALPFLRKTRSCIINISSVSGRVTFPLYGAYCSSKHAIEAYTESLWLELQGKINVYMVAPGAIQTNFFASGAKIPEADKTNQLSTQKIQANGNTSWRSKPEEVAQKLYFLALKRPATIRHSVGHYSVLVPLLYKLLPDALFYTILRRFM